MQSAIEILTNSTIFNVPTILFLIWSFSISDLEYAKESFKIHLKQKPNYEFALIKHIPYPNSVTTEYFKEMYEKIS